MTLLNKWNKKFSDFSLFFFGLEMAGEPVMWSFMLPFARFQQPLS